ncbi:acyl carrier protein [Bacillus toyonensis]|jgi:acyl carrier protein|uniref:Carrier domain-containing protein n=1 Tax=Bacillus toyonensis TaxID=155322 RepID=A0AB73R955_9BACI|nr:MULTISPECIES: acyl carrier protein [Bacillus cereus group]OTX04677.1 hypothetical protein BK712_18910 [Bacillus thuringiensis serovar seoulensis]MBH0358306.1 acyl carrier protein [Bacillus toyonensis biovar Thuringiensis]MDT3498367.1 acyl carrier protein [Bacillus toyonensis]MED3201913.1 acyl carrier protein [Bacillus toyonensis]NKW97345.1 acyl carrier protein [Bacillus toyonensis]
MRDSIIELLQKQIHIDINTDDDQDLLFVGFNSIAFMHFIVDLEVYFEFEVFDEELTLDNFTTINKIITFVQNKKGVVLK